MFNIINRFTCTEKQLPKLIFNLKNKNFLPILDYTNENPKFHLQNFNQIKKLITTHPENTIAVKLSSLNIINNYNQSEEYLYNLTQLAIKNNSKLLIDAEDYNIQNDINKLSNQFMKDFNKDHVNIYKTYQMYRKDTLELLKNDFLENNRNYKIGCKLVRGAYYNQDFKYNILFEDINQTHQSYNNAIEFFSKNFKNNDILMCATHNEDSVNYAIKMIKHYNLNNVEFAQLLGMSNKLSSRLSKNHIVYKYLPYGDFKDTLPYLIRRLYENYPMITKLLK
tara:strand:+ start:720 stop:1559 length:840 start_codon:yes stop_codon:yes gene_type:complete